MKKRVFLIVFLCAVLAASSASAIVVSHRYIIPGTEYTIEFPYDFQVFSSEMDEYEPLTYDWGIDLEEAKQAVKQLIYDVMAIPGDTDKNKASVWIQVLPAGDFDSTLISREASEEDLEEFGESLAIAFFEAFPSYSPYVVDNRISFIEKRENCNFIGFAYQTEEHATHECFANSSMFFLLEKDYIISITVDFDTEEFNDFFSCFDIIIDILDSVKYSA